MNSKALHYAMEKIPEMKDDELRFWRDFVAWLELMPGKSALKDRAAEALEEAESRYRMRPPQNGDDGLLTH